MGPYGMPPFDPSDEHRLNMQMRRIREKSVDQMEQGIHESLKIFGNPEMAEAIAKMKKTQFDAYRMAGFTPDQAMALLLGYMEARK